MKTNKEKIKINKDKTIQCRQDEEMDMIYSTGACNRSP